MAFTPIPTRGGLGSQRSRCCFRPATLGLLFPPPSWGQPQSCPCYVLCEPGQFPEFLASWCPYLQMKGCGRFIREVPSSAGVYYSPLCKRHTGLGAHEYLPHLVCPTHSSQGLFPGGARQLSLRETVATGRPAGSRGQPSAPSGRALALAAGTQAGVVRGAPVAAAPDRENMSRPDH